MALDLSPVVGFLAFEYNENPLLGISKLTVANLTESITVICGMNCNHAVGLTELEKIPALKELSSYKKRIMHLANMKFQKLLNPYGNWVKMKTISRQGERTFRIASDEPEKYFIVKQLFEECHFI
ncbi:hypothetical protein TNCT_113421 [Trichonephila clavata]|uniref:Uncharacterized protein n=1 Tax=Trichonephila clavata TaxID=2740835 RepID=A0A8X6I0I9_TRICU|nr:hypothetical protein TNCT_113421 [Trichonephila clavata]